MLNKSKEFKITHNNTSFKVRLTYIDSVVTNIEVKLTREQRRQILCKLLMLRSTLQNLKFIEH